MKNEILSKREKNYLENRGFVVKKTKHLTRDNGAPFKYQTIRKRTIEFTLFDDMGVSLNMDNTFMMIEGDTTKWNIFIHDDGSASFSLH